LSVESSRRQTPVRKQAEGNLPQQIHRRANANEMTYLEWLEETLDCVMDVWQPQIQDK
jgi:hypothetical protein